MGFSGPVGFGNVGKPGGPARLGPAPGFRQGGPVGFGNVGHGGPAPAFMRAGGNPSATAPPQSVTTPWGSIRNDPRLGMPPGFHNPPGFDTVPGTGQGFGTVPGTGKSSGLDSTYYQQLNDATTAANNKINAYNQQSGYAGVDLQNALAQLNYQQGLQTQNTQDAENSRGGFALGHLGQTLGQLNHAYLDRGAQDSRTYQRQQAARDAAVAAVRQGLSVEQAALAAASADRASANAAKNPAAGQSSAPLTPGGGPPAPGTEGAPPGGKTLGQVPGNRFQSALNRSNSTFARPGGRVSVQQALNRSNARF